MTAPVLAGRLGEIVGPRHVLSDPDVLAGHEADITGRYRGRAALVVRPASTAEVAAVVRACAAASAPLVPQGGNTGLVGGGVPRDGEVVLSLTRLDAISAVDEAAGQVTAGAGATLGALQEHLRATGWAFGVDLGARDSATLGGMAATNAGGSHVLRHGAMRAQIVGLEAVLPDGGVVSRLSGVVKDNAGFDLPALLVGSEGTLGVITALRLRLVPAPPRATTALVALADTAAAVDLLPRLRERAPSLQAVELFYPEGLALVRAHRRLPDPFGGALTHEPGAYVLVECAGRDDPLPELAEALRGAVDDTHVVVATDTAARRALWAYREAHNETLNARGVPHKLDVCVPIGALATFEAEVRALVEDVAPGSLTVLWAHLGDGNVHVNVLGPAPEDERVDEAVLRLAVAHGGSISAEHGIGVAKARFLPLGRGEDERRAMAAVKRALDPQGLLNPGVLLPPTDPRGEGNHP